MTLSRVDLERFDDGAAQPPKESADFKRGFEAGQLSAQAASAADLARAVQGISTTLADMGFGYTEARVLLLDRIRPLLAQVAETVLPQVGRDGFAAHLVDVLNADFKSVIGEPIQVSVAPSALEHLASALPESGDFTFVADTSLADGQALVRNSDTHTLIDLPALIGALQSALNGLESTERSLSNG